jgi:hypothetical protein
MTKIVLTIITLFLHLPAQAQIDSTFDVQNMLYKVSDLSNAHFTYFDIEGKSIRNRSALSNISPDLEKKIVKVLNETDFSNYFKVKNTDTLKLTLSITVRTNRTLTLRIIGDPILVSYNTLLKTRIGKVISKEKFPLKQVSIYEIHFFSIRMSPIKREKRSFGYKTD